MRKFLFLALALAAPATLSAQEADNAVIAIDWTLAKPQAEKGAARNGPAAVRRPKAATRKPGARLRGGATMSNRNVRARKKAKVGVAIPF